MLSSLYLLNATEDRVSVLSDLVCRSIGLECIHHGPADSVQQYRMNR